MRIAVCQPAWLLSIVIVAWGQALSGATVTVNNFSDLLFWTGSGTNASALVLQFGDEATPTSIAWGYRWDEPVEESPAPTVADMVFALTGQISGSDAPQPVPGADPRLAIDVTYYAPTPPDFNGGYFANSFSYVQVGLPSPWSQGVRSLVNDYDNDFSIGFYTAVADTVNPLAPWPPSGLLSLAPLGIADVPLANGGWYGFVVQELIYPPGPPGETWPELPSTVNFSQPVSAVPEPGTWALLAGAAGVVGCSGVVRRRRVRVA
jgi:hypothetical protein